jgi:hypothetical protein
MTDTRIKRTVKGRRPQFNDDLAVDNVHGMIMALAAELAALHDQVDSMQRVAAAKGIVLREEVENFVPDAQTLADREHWRQGLLKRMFYVLREQVDDVSQRENEKKYQDFLREIA